MRHIVGAAVAVLATVSLSGAAFGGIIYDVSITAPDALLNDVLATTVSVTASGTVDFDPATGNILSAQLYITDSNGDPPVLLDNPIGSAGYALVQENGGLYFHPTTTYPFFSSGGLEFETPVSSPAPTWLLFTFVYEPLTAGYDYSGYDYVEVVYGSGNNAYDGFVPLNWNIPIKDLLIGTQQGGSTGQVPEPSTFALFGLALAPLVSFAWRRCNPRLVESLL